MQIIYEFKKVVHALRPRVPVNLFIGAAYTSIQGQNVVRDAANRPSKDTFTRTQFFASHTLTRSQFTNAVQQELKAKNVDFTTAPLSTIMPHKVPNHVSFAPGRFGTLLEAMMPQPPYKRA